MCAELEGRLDGSALELFIRGVKGLAPGRGAFLEGPWGAIVSLSPELFLERRGRRVRTAPIKGTRQRPVGLMAAGEERVALERSGQDRAENVMIVDLMRNDLGRVCDYGAIGIASPHAGLELSVAIRTFEVSGTRIRLGVGGAWSPTPTRGQRRPSWRSRSRRCWRLSAERWCLAFVSPSRAGCPPVRSRADPPARPTSPRV